MARFVASALALLLLASPAARAAEKGTEAREPRATMQRAFEALSALLPASLEEGRFRDPARRAELLAALDALAADAEQLDAHGRQRDQGFRLQSRSFASSAREIQELFARGRYEEARFLLSDFTQSCVACHARLPSARDFPLAKRLSERIDAAALSAFERARLQLATRDFDAALATFEATFADPARSPVAMDLQGTFLDYLTVAIRVKGDLERPRRTLEALARRPDLPRYLLHHVRSWLRELREVRELAAATPGLAPARALLARSRELAEFPGDRDGLVHDLVASSLLYRYVDATRAASPEVAEAFYLLGVIEARTVPFFWVPQAEHLLEASIRTQPRGPFAEPAYALLEEYIVLGYGVPDLELPAEVRERLAELRGLIDGSAPGQPVPR